MVLAHQETVDYQIMKMNNMKEKLLKIQEKPLKALKDTKAYNYKYATLEQVWNIIQPLVQEQKLVVVHKVKENKVCTGVLDTESEEEVWSEIALPDNLEPQKIGSAITYYRRYNLLQLFNVIVEDDDGESAKPVQKAQAKPVGKPFDYAAKAIENCESQEDIDKVSTQIEKSTKLTSEEKVQLHELLEERLGLIFNKI